ncbi:MAG TPA: recombinase family protein [Terriglobales bacterium]|nr:recombinase family protein [Terriglobales bacterium]
MSDTRNTVPKTVCQPIPAAQYVRMSDDGQQYSIDNQKAAIQEYAKQHGFVIVRTYADAGKSGVVLNRREALRTLLEDVDLGKTDYKAILVYDVSRWGRFQNSDEAAHYEFLCTRSGIRLHYCAEQFTNDDTPSTAILKALKRSMAAEFSRELGVKVYEGKKRLVKLGFWVGAKAGYGYRRMMLSADGRQKQKLGDGERKSLTTDRVTLVLGPRKEVECVRRMFAMVIEHRHSCTEIARQLNRDRIPFHGNEWERQDVFNVVTHPKYAGYNVWARTSAKLRSKVLYLGRERWLMTPGAFPAIVDQTTFDRVQVMLPRNADRQWTDGELLRKLKQLLAVKGRLSESIILNARGMPTVGTLHRHFGSYKEMYALIDYHPPAEDIFRTAQTERSLVLRRELICRIKTLFPKNVTVFHFPKTTRSILRFDNDFNVSVVLCRTRPRDSGGLDWIAEPAAIERGFITLLCTVSPNRDRVLRFYVFAAMDFRTRRFLDNDPWLRTGVRLKSLSEFYAVVTSIHKAQGKLVSPA